MDWIAVHSDVLGGKLRGLWKRIDCSEAEALGALTILWLWARNNATETGELKNTDESDIVRAIRHSLSDNISPDLVVEAMIEEGWIDKIDGILYIHDWADWQSYWYAFIKRKANDAERKRRQREREKEEQAEAEEEPKPTPAKTRAKRAKKEEVKKIQFADFVEMTEEEFSKLIEQYGEQFARQCIVTLDNYKGSSGKKYKSDYRAILMWVVDKVKKEYPGLQRIVPTFETAQAKGNSFEEFRDLW